MVVDHLHPEARDGASAVAERSTGSGSGTGDDVRLECVLDVVPVEPSEHGTIAVLRMFGEIDLSTQTGTETALGGALQAGPRHLLVDLSGVGFCGARGFTTLADTARSADDQEIEYALCGLAPHVGRAATFLWGSDGPDRYRSLAAAMTTIRARHAHRG